MTDAGVFWNGGVRRWQYRSIERRRQEKDCVERILNCQCRVWLNARNVMNLNCLIACVQTVERIINAKYWRNVHRGQEGRDALRPGRSFFI